MTMKKVLAIVIAAVLLVAGGVSVGVSGVLDPYEQQIRLGYKLMGEGNYEEAILAFDAAIEIDVKRDKAYIGKADVYVSRCDTTTLEDVKAVLKLAYDQHYNDDNIINAFIRLADELIAKDKGEWAIELLNYGYELTQNGRIKEHKSKVLNGIAGGFLAELYRMFEEGDDAGVKKEIQSEKYLSFMEMVDDSDYKYIYFPDNNSNQTGKGIALYYVDSSTYGKLFAYYGDFENGLRSGNGIWMGANGIQYYWFEGAWSNDAPNGSGKIMIVKDESKIAKEPNHTYAIEIETAGSFKNGLYHGDINETWKMDSGETMVWSTISAIDGVYQKMESTSSGVSVPESENEYNVAVTADGANLVDSGSKRSIIGF